MKNSAFLYLVMLSAVLSSCTDHSNIEEQNKALVLKAKDEILVKGNMDFIDEIFSSEYTNHRSPERGPQVIKKFVTTLRTAFPDLQVTIEPIIAEGNMVAWQRTQTGTHQAEYMGIPATGKKITWRSMIISHIVDGKVIEEWAIHDFLNKIQSETIKQ